MFYGFILDIVKAINEYVAVNYLIIHAIDKRLVKYYQDNYGFSEFELNSSETENIQSCDASNLQRLKFARNLRFLEKL